MKIINKIKLTLDSTIKEALKIIDNASMQIAIVVDKNDVLIGTVTDGDIRRGLLNGMDLDDTVKEIVFKNPTTAKISDTKEDILKKAISKKLHQIPIVDDLNRVISIKEIDELVRPQTKSNKVLLMVGGLGTRLRPLTENTPKPMLKVGNRPILQTIVEKFAEYGFINITMCVNYKSQIIKDFFGDGSEFGVNIEYILEEERMGTAGALSLLRETPTEPFFVMNGDLLTNVNFENLFDYHVNNNSAATMCVREYDFQVPYGVVNLDNNKILSIEEKPVHKFFVSAGIYMLSPQVIKSIPENEFYDMPTLFEKLISENEKTVSFPLREYWLDIGRMEEFEQANKEYDEFF
ncbi:MAG: nucleotidyltransferase family protein [Sulfurimonas sp.]|nr:nucleotidyltransferase family protein [Sulfurimonas sp.]